MEIVTIVFTVVIALLSFWILFKLKGYGGVIGRSLNSIGYGTVVLGFSQVLESAVPDSFGIDPETIHMSHHFIFIVGLTMVAWGFKNLMDKR
ncbi:MAG: hypothetical protein WC764_04155 [Candidatus Paceibacterota bacterium]|jgi:hypothetical protein